MKKTDEPKFVFIVLLILIVTVFLPYVIRYATNQPLLFSGEPYYYLRIGMQTLKQSSFLSDPLVAAQRNLSFNLYPTVLSGLFLLGNAEYISIGLPILLGIFSFLLFYRILKSFAIRWQNITAALVLLVISPTYLAIFSRSSPSAFAVLLNLLGFYLLKKEHVLCRISSVILLSMVPFFGLAHGVITLIFLLTIYRERKYALSLIIVSVILMAYFSLSYTQVLQNISFNQPRDYFSDFGGLYGFGFFNLILGFTGIFITWSLKKELLPFYAAGVGSFVVSVFDPTVNMYLMLLFSLIGAVAFVRLYKMRWELEQIKFLSIMLVACGLMFSTLSFIGLLASFGPSDSLGRGLVWLANEDANVVLTHYSRGFWVESIAGKKVLIDDFSKDRRLLNDSMTMFYSRNLKKTRELLDGYNISHIVIDADMKHGLVWQKDDEGMLFLFRNNETFNRIYNKAGVEIWKVLPAEER